MQDYRYKRGLEYIRACAALSKNQPPKELDLLVDYDRMCESLRTNFPDDKITAGGIEYDIKYLDDAREVINKASKRKSVFSGQVENVKIKIRGDYPNS